MKPSCDRLASAAAFLPLPPPGAVRAAFGSDGDPPAGEHRILVLPVLANPLCEHHLVLYTTSLQGDLVRLVAFAKRESLDPQVPARDWTKLCRADMPAERLEEFTALLEDRLNAGPIELKAVGMDELPS